MKTKNIITEKKIPIQTIRAPKKKEAIIVISQFSNYKKGKIIIDSEKIKEILSGSFSICVNKILLG